MADWRLMLYADGEVPPATRAGSRDVKAGALIQSSRCATCPVADAFDLRAGMAVLHAAETTAKRHNCGLKNSADIAT